MNWTELIAQRRAEVAERPDDANRPYNLGLALMQSIEGPLKARQMGAEDRSVAEESERCLRRALELAAHHGRAHIMLGMLLRYTGRGEEAIPHLTYAMGLPRESQDWLHASDTLAGVYMEMERAAEAAKILETQVEAHPKAPYFYKLGVCYQFLGRLDDARRVLEAGLKRAPGDAQLQTTLAQVRQALAPPPVAPAPAAGSVQERVQAAVAEGQRLGLELQQKIMALMQGPAPQDEKMREMQRLQAEFQAKIAKLTAG